MEKEEKTAAEIEALALADGHRVFVTPECGFTLNPCSGHENLAAIKELETKYRLRYRLKEVE